MLLETLVVEKWLLTVIQKIPFFHIQILAGTGREIKSAFIQYIPTSSY